MTKSNTDSIQELKTAIAVIQRDVGEMRDHTNVWNIEMGDVKKIMNVNCTNLALLEERIKSVSDKVNWNNALTLGISLVLAGIALKTFGVV